MLPLHVGGDLDPRHGPEVDSHLNDCLVCFREFRELGAMRGRLGVLSEELLPAGILDGFAEEVMARIDVGEPGPAAEAPSPGPRQRIFSFQRMSAAAAIMVVALAGWRAMEDQGLLGTNSFQQVGPVVADSVNNMAAGQQQRRPAPQPVLAAPVAAAPRASQFASGGQSTVMGGAQRSLAGELRDLLDTAWPAGVPQESQVQIVLRLRAGVPTVMLHGLASDATGLERDDERLPRQREP
ncbi:MAG: hypothetical protein ACI9EF_002362 [Pseudohongiellaceae bacterium]|jgi:hypothetical protein